MPNLGGKSRSKLAEGPEMVKNIKPDIIGFCDEKAKTIPNKRGCLIGPRESPKILKQLFLEQHIIKNYKDR